MAEQRIYKCRCGSTEFETDGSGVSTCSYCGCKFVVQNGCTKFKILPETDEKHFLRSAWIHLACKDVPFDVFDNNFGNVDEMEFQVMVDSVSARVLYQASIGYDREEAYQETQSYSERVPYTETSRVYDSHTKSYVNRSVTRYRNEERQRQVTKFRTVTHWKPFSTRCDVDSTIYVKNGDIVLSPFEADADEGYGLGSDSEERVAYGDDSSLFDSETFQLNLEYTESDSVVAPDVSECEQMTMSPRARREARKMHDDDIDAILASSVCGDRHKDLSYSVKVTESSSQLYLTPEYRTSIAYEGKRYELSSLPFGEIPVRGGEIENENGVKAYTERELSKLDEKKKELEETASNDKWQSSKNLLLATTIMLAVSIVGMLSIGVSSFVLYVANRWAGYPVALFVFMLVFAAVTVAGVVIYIVGSVMEKRNASAIEADKLSRIGFEEEETDRDISAFTKDHRAKQLDVLNKKLKSLGYGAATMDEISKSESEAKNG